MSKVARLLQADIRARNPRVIQKRSDAQFKQAVRSRLWEQAKAMAPEQAQQMFGPVPGFNGRSVDQVNKIMGRGGYWGRRLGNFLGDTFGMAANSTLRRGLVHATDMAGDAMADAVPYGNTIAFGAEHLAKLTGHGGYAVSGASAGPVTAVPSFDSSGGDVTTVRMRNREYLGAIPGSVAFALRSLRLNPGDIQTFPQLSKVAQFYDEYKFHGLVFYFKSTSSDTSNSSDTAIGTLMMGSTTDPVVAAPNSKTQMVRLDMGSEGKPSQDQFHGIECASSQIKYVRHGTQGEAARDSVFFDEGNFHIATEGQPGTVANPAICAVSRIGELWVSYDVELLRPRDDQGQGTPMYQGLSSINVNTFALCSNNVAGIRSLPLILANNSITFPQFITDGDYIITLQMSGVAVAAGPYSSKGPSITMVNGNVIADGGTSSETSAVGTAGAIQFYTYSIRVNAPGISQAVATFDLTGVFVNPTSSLPGTTSGLVKLQVVQVPTLSL